MMTSKERMLAAITGKPVDRIPCSPDISNLVPARLTGKPFYDIYYHNNPPIWKAYLDAVDYFGFDGWFLYGGMVPDCPSDQCSSSVKTELNENGDLLVYETVTTPKGDLSRVGLYPKDATAEDTEKFVKNFREDIDKLKYLFPIVERVDDTLYKEQAKLLGDKGLMAVCLPPCGFSTYFYYFNGLEDLTYAYYDEPELFEEFNEHYERHFLSYLTAVLEKKPESILLGMSGAITLQSPEIFDHLALPGIKKAVRMAHGQGVPIGIHACGKSRYLLNTLLKETDLDYIHPLEVPPMGDITLAEARQIVGDRMTLMGNIHTTNVMYFGNVEDVRKSALQAICDAGENGRFILSTGDQCGRDTPDENIRELMRVCESFGRYPLDMSKIKEELQK